MELPFPASKFDEFKKKRRVRVKILDHPLVRWHHELGSFAGKEVEVIRIQRLPLGDYVVFKKGSAEYQISTRFIVPITS